MSWNVSSDPSSSRGPRFEEPQQVFIGIFPGSHIFIREELPDAEGSLADVAAAFQNDTRLTVPDGLRPKVTGSREIEEDDRKSFRLGPPPEQANSSRAGLPVYPASIRSLSPTGSQNMKPLPPRPSLKSNDETASGVVQPIVDEIASALREWHMLMFQYLARRDYQLFRTVREHIEALHLGRRQLLTQTLSDEETANLRRDCVARLVSGNIVQNLDVIVRHPSGGGLVTVDVEGDIDTRNWMSAVRMYALQASLADADASVDSSRPLRSRHSLDTFATSPLPTPAHSAFPEYNRPKTSSLALYPSSYKDTGVSTPKFFHVFLELRAFVASPCAPGETAELYFSLYNKTDSRFVTEDFCVILNHHGVLARDPSARIRTLFTDLSQPDIQGAIFLVCRIVRNGSVKIGPNPSSGIPQDNGFRGSSSLGWASSPTDVSTSGNLSTTPSTSDGGATFRRPFGCAVLELSQLTKVATDPAEVSSTKEHTMHIFTPVNEATFSMLHQDIINNDSKEFEKSSRYVCLCHQIGCF